MSKAKYPIYRITVKTDKGSTTRHTKRKRTFLAYLDQVLKTRGLKKFSFSVEYFKGGFNYSIDYKPNQLKEAKWVASIFTNKAEEKFLMS